MNGKEGKVGENYGREKMERKARGKKMMVQRKCKEKEGRDRRERKRVKGRRN